MSSLQAIDSCIFRFSVASYEAFCQKRLQNYKIFCIYANFRATFLHSIFYLAILFAYVGKKLYFCSLICNEVRI